MKKINCIVIFFLVFLFLVYFLNRKFPGFTNRKPREVLSAKAIHYQVDLSKKFPDAVFKNVSPAQALNNTTVIFDLFQLSHVKFERPLNFKKMKSEKKNGILIDQFYFPKEFTIIVQGQTTKENGDLLGGGDCLEDRFLIHAPHNNSMYFMLGSPSQNSLRFYLDSTKEGQDFNIVLSKQSNGIFSVGLNNTLQTSKVGNRFLDPFLTSLSIGSSKCEFLFSGQIRHFIVLNKSIDEFNMALLLRSMKSPEFSNCKSNNLAKCFTKKTDSQRVKN